MSVKSKAAEKVVEDSPFLEDWGFTLKDLYNLALKFFKDKEGKAMHFTYEERLKLVALTCQVSHGKFDPQTAPPLGVLDVIGKDRRLAWQTLGDKTKADCMHEFITTLNKQCPLFKPFVEAHKRDSEAKESLRKTKEESEKQNQQEYQNEQEIQRLALEEQERLEEQKRKIQDALNRQTFAQFKTYSEQQFPGNPEQQAVLIRQLQEQHYEQYMRQIYQQQLFVDEIKPTNDAESSPSKSDEKKREQNNLQQNHNNQNQIQNGGFLSEEHVGDSEKEVTEVDHEDPNALAAASMWTLKGISEFKESVKAEGGEAVIRINQGESVTVRVPTHEDGTCLFWEFATDSYDIGFGLFFEWTNADEPVSIHVMDENSSDDEEDDETFQALQQDVEKGRELLPKGAKPNTDVIIPVYRRDAHMEVYVGSHLFPGKGVYLLKFDNSYSFWRSKTLYYRVYYTK
ncbi:unnamed protein product [Allacma fusca]|uniref:Golgi resident protein GCP60 n=1 Tax=Allacma fusca TaxID=39272 RepID=A0A8J2PWI7_9HEXA|nr:unnamed protein product [Allacma fusca]